MTLPLLLEITSVSTGDLCETSRYIVSASNMLRITHVQSVTASRGVESRRSNNNIADELSTVDRLDSRLGDLGNSTIDELDI